MSGKAKFVHWVESPFDEIPSQPIFKVLENDKGFVNGSRVSGRTLLAVYGIPVPLFPDLKTWKRQTDAKRKCHRCWAVTRGLGDWFQHHEVVHGEKLLQVS